MAKEYIFSFGKLDVIDTDDHADVVTRIHDVACTVIETDDQGDEVGRASTGVTFFDIGEPGADFEAAISMADDPEAATAQRLGWLSDEQIQSRKDAADAELASPARRQIT
jgi:hypothetical protein